MQDFDIAVIGAGILGTSAALWAQMRGHRVLLADPNPPGSGTSSGNACTLATYACLPVNDPSVLTGLPKLMFGPESPLAVSYVHALRNPRWMLSFLANCRAARAREIAGHLAGLLAHADAGLNPLIAEAGAEDLVVSRGQLSIWSTEAGAEGAEAGLALRRDFGVPFTELSAEEARAMEPGLTLPIARAVHFTGARHIRDPEELVRRLHARFIALGGQWRQQAATEVRADDTGVTLRLGDDTVTAGRAVLAAGAFSRRVRRAGAEGLPLGTERGYHLLFAGEGHRLTRPVGWGEGGFYAVPMARGLRLAGTVEIAALDAPENAGRLAYIGRKGAEMLGPLPAPDSHWLGYRPTMPDALPVLGYSPTSDRIIHAFGHQHLGLTLGGISGRIVADLAEGRQPNLDIAPFRPGRSYAPL
ncbi:NAD(P)/FAD-dependent oxidoreductase [Antarcticimicrobium luteum]|uniref:FAD-binding oxidoreductase n=1 Tax=Antarcticimicrobium luteum TaxID=2547397 RepID=A0A4R5UR66_9RHOB|nr:FAD-binding oxidoreductase [Antarcticimicrobium luteum]TDK41421.1 FAD-binding oxidoreductase [Antarcticimicrobium luteum]